MGPLYSNQMPAPVSWMLSIHEFVAEPPAWLAVAMFPTGWAIELRMWLSGLEVRFAA